MWAHSGKNNDHSDWEPLPDHLHRVGALAGELGRPLGLERTSVLAGLFHDLGKFHPQFQARINGAAVRVDHSTAGAAVLMREAARLGRGERLAAEAVAYAILGHHAGLPDMASDSDACANERITGFTDGLAPSWPETVTPDLTGLPAELAAKIRPADPARAAFDLSLAVRMVFSCLVDADRRATEQFYAELDGYIPDRDWPALGPHLNAHLAALDNRLAEFPQSGAVNGIRREVMSHVRKGAARSPGAFTLTVPTGGGKTLASLGFALEHARRHGHQRIIYVIPFTSIIDQTADEFRRLLGGDHVLEHHASIDLENSPGDHRSARDKLRLAMEDWAAPFVITTAVQFFESLFAARTSRARKLHSIAGSIIILDEAQTLPRGLLAPCLRMLDALCAHYGCTVVLCTATQPALDERLTGTQMVNGAPVQTIFGLPLAGRELAPDPAGLNARLRRTRIEHGGVMDDAALVDALAAHLQSLVVVNSRRHALELYRAAAHLDGAIHLTTRQHAADRTGIIAGIHARLAAGEPCRVIATSLIEAGVDLSFRRAWRAEAGLDQIIQVAGRVNRGGEYPVEDSIVTVFQPADHKPPREIAGLIGDFRAIMAAHGDLQSDAAVDAYFRQVYWRHQLGRNGLDAKDILPRLKVQPSPTLTDFAFRSIAEDFRMIESGLAPVIVVNDPDTLAGRLRGAESSGRIARELQRFVVQVPPRERARMIADGAVGFLAPEVRGDQFAVLQRRALYSREVGLIWEEAELLTAEESIF
ncbi:CRISPR-associated endonuclease Cas3'' [Paracoccus endophyticus]|uniref:CRISPR-associated endonuclease Cas3'' n=1 Tax=Paracoccus endophyticus TaxID=2233774 RepID=UPI001F0C684A|nr:CRISPR-associated endonuclease Cas3'' [Paracoccus endophyticus]